MRDPWPMTNWPTSDIGVWPNTFDDAPFVIGRPAGTSIIPVAIDPMDSKTSNGFARQFDYAASSRCLMRSNSAPFLK